MGFDNKFSGESKLPVSRDPQIVRDRILDAAQAEFMRVGYAAANTNQIAQRGISKATIFRHFASKQELFESVVERIAERWRHGIAVDAIPGDDPDTWLVAFATVALQRLLTDEVLFVGRMAVSEGDAHGEVRNLWPRLATRPIHRALTDRIEAWQAAGTLRPGDPQQLAMAFLDLALAGEVSRALYGSGRASSAAQRRAHVETCVGIFLNGCAAPPGQSGDQPE